MNGRRAFFAFMLCGILTANKLHALNAENGNQTIAEVTITENGLLKQIEVRNSSNLTAALPESPRVIQQGNNLYIKPKFIIGSSFTSYKQGSNAAGCCDNIAITSRMSNEETRVVIGKPPTPQFPPVMIPPAFLPSMVENGVSIPPLRFPVYPQMPITFPSPCLPINDIIQDEETNIPMRCPPFVSNVQVPKFPTLTDKPVVIPKPPVLPPINLPKFPVQVIIQKPLFPRLPSLIAIPDQSIIVPLACPPTIQCIPTEREAPRGFDILTTIFEKFKKLLSSVSRIDISQFYEPDEEVLVSDTSPAFPTLCAQGIIAERIMPNIIKNDHGRVIMSRAFPAQLLSGFNRK